MKGEDNTMTLKWHFSTRANWVTNPTQLFKDAASYLKWRTLVKDL